MQQEHYWQAVQQRDRAFDGQFVYGVCTTGIYCRPSCAARRPLRQHVQFFASPAEAERARFRACLRCQPQQPAPPDVALATQMCAWIDTQAATPPSLAALGAQFGLSPTHAQRMFKRVVGVTPRQYAETRRLEQLKTHLRQGQPVTESIYEAGYASSSQAYERAVPQLGMTPTIYRKGGAGMEIAYALGDCALGRVLLAATTRGVCAVSLGDDDATLIEALQAEYPAAQIVQSEDAWDEWGALLLAHMSGPLPARALPLDVQATAFQQQVWQMLQTIPPGETRTYQQLAAAIGKPSAVRAVARACATNPVSVVIPCHRVVRSDGGLGGYRWGLERKRALLEHEAALAAAGTSTAEELPRTGTG